MTGAAQRRVNSQGHGLDGMRERAALYGGELLARTLPQGGWSVSTTMRLGRADVATPVPR